MQCIDTKVKNKEIYRDGGTGTFIILGLLCKDQYRSLSSRVGFLLVGDMADADGPAP